MDLMHPTARIRRGDGAVYWRRLPQGAGAAVIWLPEAWLCLENKA